MYPNPFAYLLHLILLPDTKTAKPVTGLDASNDSAVTGSASMNVARLAKTYSAYLLKPSPSSILLHKIANVSTVVSTISTITSSDPKESTKLGKGVSKPILAGVPDSHVESADNSLLENLGLFESIQVS